MNRPPDVELVLRAYLADTGDRAPDHVLEDVAARIARQPRRPWRLQGRPMMSTYAKLVAAAAAIVIVTVVAWQFLPAVGVPDPEPSRAPVPTATLLPPASPTAAPSRAAVAPCPDGLLPGGTCRLTPLGSAPNLTVDLTAPAGWLASPDCCLSGPVGESNGPNGIALAFLAAEDIFSDPCHWNVNGSGPRQPGDVKVGPSVDELATALASSPAYQATTPVDVTIGGFAGKRVELDLPAGDCDTWDGNPIYLVFGGRDGYAYAQGDGSHWQISIVDVDGTRLIAALFSYSETSAADLSAGQAIVDSLVITP